MRSDKTAVINALRCAAGERYGDLGDWGNQLIENQAADLISSQVEEIKRLREAIAAAKDDIDHHDESGAYSTLKHALGGKNEQ